MVKLISVINYSINPVYENDRPSYLSQEVLNQLIELGALVQYKWTAVK